jgi:lipopolysaccharide export system permease protein
MKILRDYFLKEFISPLVLAVIALSFVFTLGYLVQIAYLVINKGVDIFSVAKLFLLRIPAIMIYILPISSLVAILLSMGRLSNDNEIVTIRASGVSLISLVKPLLTFGLLISMLMVIFNDRFIPYAHFESRKTLIEVGMQNPAAALEPGVFINSFDKYIIFIYSIDGNKLYNVRIYEPQGEDKPTRIIVAKKGEFLALPEKNLVKLKLMDGTADEPDPNNPRSFYKLNFKTYFMSLNFANAKDKNSIEKKPKDMTINELKRQIEKLKKENIDSTPMVAEINEKISLAFSSFVFILLGLPLAVITRRREKSINFGIAFIIIGVYYLMLLGLEALSMQGFLDPTLALWFPNILFGSIGAYLTYRLCVY